METVTDAELVQMYEHWSEEIYCAGFMQPTTESVAQFREWIQVVNPIRWTPERAESYELEMLAEYHRQEAERGD